MKKYWHELSKKEQQEVKHRKNYTIGDFQAEFSQPEWCQYPLALEGNMGCWSLFDGFVHGEGAVMCEQCEYLDRTEVKIETHTSR